MNSISGNDKSCEILEKVSGEAGVVVKYQKSAEHPTGKCAVLITGQDRSLVTKLDAANHFTTAHLDDKENWGMEFWSLAYHNHLNLNFFMMANEISI